MDSKQLVEMSDEEALAFKRLKAHDIVEILEHFKRLRKQGRGVREACAEIAPLYNRSPDAILYHIKRFRPTGSAAQSYLQSNALRLAMRVVRKANVDQAIDILSRPNIGVLEPVKKQEGNTGGGFFISVNADTCGAVKVGIAGGQHVPENFKSLPEGPVIDAETEDVWDEGTAGAAVSEEHAAIQGADESASGRLKNVGRGHGTGHSKRFKAAVEAAQARMKAARELAESRKIERKAKEIARELTSKV